MMRWIPAGLIACLAGLAVLGEHLRAYEFSPSPRCNYVLAEQALPAADVIVVGASRVRRGIDPDYVEALLARSGIPTTVDRLSLNLPNFPQYYPLLNRYLEHRGAPQIAYLQLLYNFKPERQDTWDLPLNPQRNLAFGRLAEIAEVQRGAPLNDTGTVLPRQLHASWQGLPAAWLTKVEMNVFSALRYLPLRVRGEMPICEHAFLRANGSAIGANGLTLDSALEAVFAAPDPEALAKWRVESGGFLPLAPDALWRQGETGQLRRLINLLQGAGTEVVFLIMPTVDQQSVDPETLTQINATFPGIEVHFPMDAYSDELADQISISFVDTHHANIFGAVHFSRALAADLSHRLAAP
jgi:hypothetical protein